MNTTLYIYLFILVLQRVKSMKKLFCELVYLFTERYSGNTARTVDIFRLNLKYLGCRTEHISKQQNKVPFLRNYFVKMVLRLFQPLSVVMTMVARLLRQFRRSLQIKKSSANGPRVLLFTEQPKYTYQSIKNYEKMLVLRTTPT